MNPSENLTLAHFLQSVPDEKRAWLKTYFSGEIPSIEGTERLPSKEEILKRIHSSWFKDHINSFSQGDQRALLSVLTRVQASALMEELQLEGELQEPSGLLKEYLMQELLAALLEDAPPLTSHLLPSPLNLLLQLSAQQFAKAITFLGLHDLASEVQKIIQSDKLKGIEAILSVEEKNYLKKLLEKKEMVTFGSLNLQNWDGKKEGLREVLTGRGLNRLAKALFGEAPTLIWHLTHHLDKESAQMMQKLCVDPKNAQAQKTLKAQVSAIIKELQ